MKNIHLLLLVFIALSSCRKDAQKGPIDFDYFYNEERKVLLREDFDDNLNNWILTVDSSYRDTTYPYAYFPVDTIESYNQIDNGKLSMYASNGDYTRAKLDISNINFEGLRYICIEIKFLDEIWQDNDDDHVNGERYDLYYGSPWIYDIAFQGKNHILYDVMYNNIIVAFNNEPANDVRYTYLYTNPTPKKEIQFNAQTYPSFATGYHFAGKIIVEHLEIYTIGQ